MNIKEILGSIVQIIVKVAIFAFIVMYVFRASATAYDYGYRVFAEEPVSVGEGKIISVYIENDASVPDIGKMLQEKGLIRDGKLFVIQELLSEHHGMIQPGVYDLNTSMTVQEMLEMIAVEPETEEETEE